MPPIVHVLPYALLAACAPMAAGHGVSPAASAATAPKMTPMLRTATTVSGQPLKLPSGPAEMVATAVDLPIGGRIALHRHPWSRLVYVESGRVAIHNRVTGARTEAGPGQALAEAVDQWHDAEALGGAPARLVVVDVVPPGVTNMEMPPKP